MTMTERVRVRLSRAWPITIGLHVFQSLFGATFALPFVQSVSVPGMLLRPQVAEWVGLLRIGDALGQGAVVRMLLPLALAGLNYPWVSVAWLRGLSEEAPFTEHARFALGRYRAALGVSVATVLALAALTAMSGLAALAVRVGLGDALDDRALDLARLACFVPGILGAAWLVTAQDAAYAAVSGNKRGWRELAGEAVHRPTLRLVAVRCMLVIGQAILALAAWAIPRLALGPGTAADFVVLLTTQSAALIITCLRAVWLAYVLERNR